MSLDYFKVGSREKPVVSNSSLSALNPEEGGSIVKFLNFFGDEDQERQEKESKSLSNGKLVHSYIENPTSFIIADFEKPTDMMVGLLDRMIVFRKDIKNFNHLDYEKDTSIVVAGKGSKQTLAAEAAQIKDRFEKLAQLLELSLEDTIWCFRAARKAEKAYTSYGELAVLQRILPENTKVPERQYLEFLLKGENKIVLSKEDGEAVKGMCDSLHAHPYVSLLLNLREDELADPTENQVYKEQPVYWKEVIDLENGTKKIHIPCKALLDRLTVNHTTKKIQYIDLKSTKGSIYTFQNAFEYYRYYRQMAWYKRAIGFWFRSFCPDKNFSEYTIEILIIPVQNQGLYTCGVYDVSNAWIFKGQTEAKSLLTRLAWHMQTGEYRFAKEECSPIGYKHLQFKNPE